MSKVTRNLRSLAGGMIEIGPADAYVSLLGVRIYSLTVAVTANVTTTAAPAGSLGKTSHATGRASLFVSDGSKWQYLTNA